MSSVMLANFPFIPWENTQRKSACNHDIRAFGIVLYFDLCIKWSIVNADGCRIWLGL